MTLYDVVFFQGDTIRDAIMFVLSQSEIGVEFLPAQYIGPITAWEVRDQGTGAVKCSFSVNSPLKDCIDENASAGSNNYGLYSAFANSCPLQTDTLF